ncbi:MAG: hypothetical protein H7A45_02450 [Verrucomicrobiales bacterium]|nr:hypothetical protein [Verrucomicrobiales bacterium]
MSVVTSGAFPTEPATRQLAGGDLALYPAGLPDDARFQSPACTADGREMILVDSASVGRALVDVTIENVARTIPYIRPSVRKGTQLEIDAADFPTLAATGWHDAPALLELRTITRKPVDAITAEGRPGRASSAGFLAADEDIVSVLRGDDQLARALGFKHPELARPLFHLWNLVLEQYAVKQPGRFQDDITSFRYHGQTVHVRAHPTRGYQESIFNDGLECSFDIEVWRELRAEETAFLRRCYPALEGRAWEAFLRRLSHVRTGEMVPYYVMRYGFYEGHTDYRADPLAIAWIFGLRSVEQLEGAFPGELPRVLATHFRPGA